MFSGSHWCKNWAQRNLGVLHSPVFISGANMVDSIMAWLHCCRLDSVNSRYAQRRWQRSRSGRNSSCCESQCCGRERRCQRHQRKKEGVIESHRLLCMFFKFMCLVEEERDPIKIMFEWFAKKKLEKVSLSVWSVDARWSSFSFCNLIWWDEKRFGYEAWNVVKKFLVTTKISNRYHPRVIMGSQTWRHLQSEIATRFAETQKSGASPKIEQINQSSQISDWCLHYLTFYRYATAYTALLLLYR